MSETSLSREQWETVVDEASPATFGELVAVLEERDYVPGDPASLVEAGVENGPLVVTDDSGSFAVYSLETPDTSDEEARGAAAVDANPGVDDDESGASHSDSRVNARPEAADALEDAIDFLHEQLDREVDFPEADVDTPREYFREVRGWDDETIDEKRLGWAPGNRTALLDHLMSAGYEREAILGTGLFWENGLAPVWQGRLVFPYLADGRPTFAISRRLGDDGHPADTAGVYGEDDSPAKYHKIPGQDCAAVEEPIYGVDTLEDGGDVLITEGIADAITANEAGYACLSPVTTTFKHDDRERLLALLEERDVGRVYVVQDAESPTSDLTEDADGWAALNIEQHGEGIKGAATTAGYLADRGVDARIGELPQPGSEKVDLDDYLRGWADTLAPILASAVPAEQHPAYDPRKAAIEAAERERESVEERAGDDDTALFDLDFVDVAGVSEDYRGTNPLGHHGNSENYFTVLGRGEIGFDHKHKIGYNGLTYLLVDAGERRSASPNGPVDDDELLAAWVHAKREGYLANDDPIPHAALRHLVVDHGLCNRDDLGNGWRIPQHAYNAGLDLLEDEYGVAPGREPLTNGRTDAESDPEELKKLNVTLDPEVAWRAAEAVHPDELGTDADVPITDDGTGWECPRCGGQMDVVRAAGIDAGIVRDCSAPLRDDDYSRAYEHARRGLDAPLPEYVNRETATERWDIVSGAIRQLEFGHLDEDALESEVTGRGDDVDGEGQLTLSPAWRDSDSGESVLVFRSGVVYEAHPDHEGALDVLRFVALDAGVVSWEEFTDEDYVLSGETFRDAYETAREYGAPLPNWQGTDAYHTAVLPPVDALVEEDVGNDDRLTAAYDAVADLYTEAAETGGASLLRVLPGLGKTEQVFRHATDHPVLYTAGRKELMQDGVNRAEENGASSFILPVFAENGLPTVVTDTAEAVVRENGQKLLRDRWSLVDRVEKQLPDGEELRKPEEYDGAGEDEVVLDRESCPVADGDYGLDWWIAVHAARARGYRPQQIHSNAAALFGAELPCCEDESCPYTEAWETATDPDAPIDVLIGHYTHAHVEGARTYSVRENGRVRKEPRVVAVDEFPGEAFQREFGEEFPDLAAWLATSLREDVNDRQDVLTKAGDLWNDETVREWLDDDGSSEEHGRIATVLGAAEAALDALETAEWLLEERRDACSDLGVEDALERLVDAHPEFDAGAVTSVTAAISSALTDDDNRGGHTNTSGQLNDLADRLREVQLAGASLDEDLSDALGDASHVDGALASLVGEAVDGFRERDDGGRRRLEAARTALQGGPDGCEALAMHADDGNAHPLAHALLYALLAPEDADDVATVRASNFNFGAEEDTRLSSVGYRKSRVVIDRNHHGAVINHPPALTAGGAENPTVGLDATGRDTLWELALGREVTTRDIHDSMRERREFLREVYGLQMVQTSPHANSYEGDPSGKNFDDDVELVNEVAEQYSDTVGENPAVLTTKVVENTLEERLDGVASATGHYGDLKGSNALADHRLAVLLGCQHYGDHVVERWAALGGEEAARTGHGMALDYNSPVANTALQHMREDQVMQAALRFGRDSDGALVFAHTGALRDDLPVVADGEVVRTFSEQAQAIARAAGDLARRARFTTSDVAERIDGFDPDPRTVRRVLSELADFGYLEKEETPNGYANEFSVEAEPGAAEVELPDIDSRAVSDDPGRDSLGVYYTWSVRVSGGDPRAARHRTVGSA
ncbi:hypothetical protein, partial [Haloarcula sp. Atlit-7R]|uniref:hypothetical protein n=1 Tax=Haloarcula sp. Atlit-7R TaxID=2282125 RepID=UPI000EF13A54